MAAFYYCAIKGWGGDLKLRISRKKNIVSWWLDVKNKSWDKEKNT